MLQSVPSFPDNLVFTITIGEKEFTDIEAAAIYASDNGIAMAKITWNIPDGCILKGGEIGRDIITAFIHYWGRYIKKTTAEYQKMWSPNELSATSVMLLDIRWSD